MMKIIHKNLLSSTEGSLDDRKKLDQEKTRNLGMSSLTLITKPG